MVGGVVNKQCVAKQLAEMREVAILDETDILRHEFAGDFLDQFGHFFPFGALSADNIRQRISPTSPHNNVSLCAAIVGSFGPRYLQMKLSNTFEVVSSSATKIREVTNTLELIPQAQLIDVYRALSELSAANQAYKVQCLRIKHLRETMPQTDVEHGAQSNIHSQDAMSEIPACVGKRRSPSPDAMWLLEEEEEVLEDDELSNSFDKEAVFDADTNW